MNQGGLVEVEADSFEEACKLCIEGPLPYDADYAEDSFRIDYDSIYFFNPEIPED